MSPRAHRGRKAAGHEAPVGHALRHLRAAALQHRGRIVRPPSLVAKGKVITDLIDKHQLPVAVADGRDIDYPLAACSADDGWQYIRLHDPCDPGIRFQPCTRAVVPHEDLRAGRWWWWKQGHVRECGLHGRPQTVTA
jgi:3'-phosphoadenosine 5'-phosphosulfate sulfotransferase (PAPS reductase)/FAD synthetase